MGSINVAADACLDILRRLQAEELEVRGILLRDATDRKFRYILRGLERLPADPVGIADLPSLGPLRAALGATQMLQAVAIAQNAAMAVSLRRIEASLARVERRLGGIEVRLGRIETKQTLLLHVGRSAPASRLAAARTAAVIALRAGDRTALITAGQGAEQAARDLLAQAGHLVRVREDGIPVALLAPPELADLAESVTDAARVASAIWLSLEASEQARNSMGETANVLADMRRQLATTLRDPELAVRRATADLGTDEEITATGQCLYIAMHEARGREMMIAAGVVTGDPRHLEFEVAATGPDGISFEVLDDR